MRTIASLLLLTAVSQARPNVKRGTYSTVTELKAEFQSDGRQLLALSQKGAVNDDNMPQNGAVLKCVGPMMSDFPLYNDWPLSFEQLWAKNEPEITRINGGTQYNKPLKDAIIAEGKKTKVDSRLILALIMQESTGQVDAPCTPPETLTDCGLMQLRYGRSFTDVRSIAGMVQDGIEGVNSPTPWPGYLNYLNGETGWIDNAVEGKWWHGHPFAAARIYNAGYIVPPPGGAGAVGGTVDANLTATTDPGYANMYAHDILARVYGWDGKVGEWVWNDGCKGFVQK